MSTQDIAIAQRRIGDYLSTLASSAPAPGGGSVAGLVGALAAGLGEMVVSLTPDAPEALRQACDTLSALRDTALRAGKADERAYGGYVAASKLPRSTPDEKATRRQQMQEAIRNAANVPLSLATTGVRILESLDPIVEQGSTHVLSDAEIATTLAAACVDASLVNVRINLPLIKDRELASQFGQRADDVEREAHRLSTELRVKLRDRRS